MRSGISTTPNKCMLPHKMYAVHKGDVEVCCCPAQSGITDKYSHLQVHAAHEKGMGSKAMLLLAGLASEAELLHVLRSLLQPRDYACLIAIARKAVSAHPISEACPYLHCCKLQDQAYSILAAAALMMSSPDISQCYDHHLVWRD